MSDSDAARAAIVNRALVKIGQPPKFSIDAADQMAAIVDATWAGLDAKVATIYDWTHNRRTSKPVKLAGTPENGWRFGFALPGDRIGETLAVLQQVSPSEVFLRDFMVEQGKVYTNVDPVWVRCRVALDPLYWDAGFAEAFAVALSGELAVPLLQDEELGAIKTAEAFGRPQEGFSGGLFGRLLALNRAAQPQGRKFMDDDPLTSARYR